MEKITVEISLDNVGYEVVLTPDIEDGGYVIECPSIQGCLSQGETEAEAIEMIKEAIQGCLDVRRIIGEMNTHESRILKYKKAWGYYLSSCDQSNEKVVITFYDYMRMVPEHEVDRMIELLNL